MFCLKSGYTSLCSSIVGRSTPVGFPPKLLELVLDYTAAAGEPEGKRKWEGGIP